MKIRRFIRRQSWMTQPEWRLLLRHLRAFEGMIAASGTPVTPFLVHFLEQALTLRVLVYRVECQVLALDEEGHPPLLEPESLERIISLRERLEAAVAALEDALAPAEDKGSALLEVGEEVEAGPHATPGCAAATVESSDRGKARSLGGEAAAPPKLNRAARRALKRLERAQGGRHTMNVPALEESTPIADSALLLVAA